MKTQRLKIKTEPVTANKATSDNTQKRLLIVVEDEPVVARCIELQLQPYFELQFFATAEEALACIRAHAEEIDLIILDHDLPGMNGLQLLSLIKHDPSLKNLRVGLQSAACKNILDTEIIKPDFYLEKPWTHQQMLSAIESVSGKLPSF